MKTIAFYNNKGGIGKTTFSVHVALYAAKHHIRTLAVAVYKNWRSGPPE